MARKPAEPTPYKIDPQRRVRLPPEVLDALDAKAGDFVTFDIDGSSVKIHRVRLTVDRK